MKFWQKLKSNLKGSVETISEKTVELSTIAKLRWEQYNIQKDITKNFNELGGKIYHLHTENNENALAQHTKLFFDELNNLHQGLQAKQVEIEQLTVETVDSQQLKQFKNDLEKGGGAIEQIIIEADSAFLNKKLMDIKLPKKVLFGAVVRNEKVIIPDGKTTFKLDDKVTLLGEKVDVEKALALIKVSDEKSTS